MTLMMTLGCGETCQLGKVGCWGRAHPTLCDRARTDPAFADAVRAQPPHAEIGPIARFHRDGPKTTPLHLRPWDSARPIRLGLASPDLQIGGVGAWMLDLVRATQGDPFEWIGIAVVDASRMYPPVVARFEPLVPVRHGPGAIAELGRQVDLLIVWGLQDIHEQLEDAGCRTLLVSHGNCDWTKANLRDAQRATACAGVAKAAARQFPMEVQSRVRVIYNTARLAPATLSRDEQRRAWGVPEGAKVVGFLGRIAGEKYPEGVVRAIASLPAEWVGVLVGPWESYLDTEIAAHPEIAHRIFRPGAICPDEIANVLAAFDVFLLPSIHEAHSIALTEAWLASVPVVGTVVAITEEYPDLIRAVPQRATGEEIAAAVLADAANPEGTRERVERAQAFARTELSPERFGDEWRGFLREIVESTAAGTESPPADLAAPSAAPSATLSTPYVSPLANLTEAQRLAVASCPDRHERQACCGPVDYCGRGKHGGVNGRVMTIQCVECVMAGE